MLPCVTNRLEREINIREQSYSTSVVTWSGHSEFKVSNKRFVITPESFRAGKIPLLVASMSMLILFVYASAQG